MNRNTHLENTFFLILFFFTFSLAGFSQDFLLSNEKSLFSFETSEGKKVILACDTSNKYITLRVGTKSKIKFEYPGTNKNSWKKFEYSYYLRGGGAENEGLDLNYINFTYKGLQYVIYDVYSAVENETNVGMKIIDPKTNSTVDFKGMKESHTGTLIEFRGNDLIKTGEKLFD